MVRTCSASGCSNRHESGSSIAFHKFPMHNVNVLAEWLRNIRRPNFIPTETTYLCSDHFEESCYWKGHQKSILKKEAVPTIFNRKKKNKIIVKLNSGIKTLKTKQTRSQKNAELRLKRNGKKTGPKNKKKVKYVKSILEISKEQDDADLNSSDECIDFETLSNSDDDCLMKLVIDKYVKSDHNYIKKEVASEDVKSLSDADGKGQITDAKMFEAIKEMGKTNAIILLVKDADEKLNANNRTHSDIQIDSASMDDGNDKIKGEMFCIKNEPSDPFEIEFENDIQNEEKPNNGGVRNGGNNSDSEVCNESTVGDVELYEPGEVRDSKCVGVLGRSNGDIIRLLHGKDWKLFDKLLSTVSKQNSEIESLKKLLKIERND